MRVCSSSCSGILPNAHRSIGGIANVVATAMVTIIVKRSWLIAPIESPIVATMTSVEPRAFMPQARASDSATGEPTQCASQERSGELADARDGDQAEGKKSKLRIPEHRQIRVQPGQEKKTGMNSAMTSPRSCSSMWRVRIGDSPTRIPATKAPSTV